MSKLQLLEVNFELGSKFARMGGSYGLQRELRFAEELRNLER